MANIHNDRFKDAIDKLNKMAYMLVNGNAKAWASKAAHYKIISYKDRARIEQLVDLRNSMGHGNSVYINVGPNEVKEVNKYITIMSNNSDKLKGKSDNNEKNSGGYRGGSSHTSAPMKKYPSSGVSTSRQYYNEMYNYTTPHSSTSTSSAPYQFVSAPPKTGLFGKIPDNYGWVICNHVGEFLTSSSYVWWSSSFSYAVVFKTEKEAKEQVDFFLRNSSSWGSSSVPFFRVRCIKLR